MTPILKLKIRRLHFIAIGGIGMSGIAEVLLNLGFEVSGSDLRKSEITDKLESLGATIFIGHDANNVHGADVVVYSSAISPENPEMQEAKRLGIPLIPRAEMLTELMRMKSGIAVAGTHGKTTTTSLLAWITSRAGMDPTFVVGGKILSLATHARLGEGEFFIVEADESDGSFLKYSPVISVVTNIDDDHLDYYHDIENIKSAFVAFINKVPFYGAAILCIDNRNVQEILPQIMRPYVTYGFSKQARYTACKIEQQGARTFFSVCEHGEIKLETSMVLPGRHNVQNALGAIAAARELNIPYDVIGDAIESFGGVYRRFELKGMFGNVPIYDDYGHHPSEIRATLAAAREAYPDKRIIAVFQPHRYTRTKDHLLDFASSFHDADLVLATEIYAASETPIPGISGRKVFEEIRKFGHKNIEYFPTKEEIIEYLQTNLSDDDIVITLGAGDINAVGIELVKRSKEG